MVRTRSQAKTIYINCLPLEIFCLIIHRLSLKNKFLLKAVCKKWNSLLISDILPRQDKLSFEDDYSSAGKCIDPDHHLDFQGNYSIPLLPVKGKRNRKRFFQKEVTGVKILKSCGGRDAIQAIKYCVSEGSSLSLQCLDVVSFQEPLVKVLPNLQHFSAEGITLVSLVSVFQYCPVLTHLSINTALYGYDFVDTLMNLPKGLQYLMLEGKSCDCLAVFCSPAMQTLESVVLENWTALVFFNKPDATVKPAPCLQRFKMNCQIHLEEDRRMIVDFLKECPALKKIDIRVSGFTREEFLNVYSGLSNLEMINLDFWFKFNGVIRMIHSRNRTSLKYLEIENPQLLNFKSMQTLAEFENLQTLSFSSILPSNGQLLAFARRRLDISQSRLQLKSNAWNENHVLDPLVSAFQGANIELVEYGKYPSVMD